MLSMLLLLHTLLMSVQPDWTWSHHPESGFKVLTPFTLTHKITPVPTDGQPIIYHQYHGGTLDDSMHLTLVIDHYQIPADELASDKAYLREFFGVTVDQILQAVEGSLIYMDFTSYSDREVCVWRGSYLEGKGIIRGELIISNNNYYGLQAFGLSEYKPDVSMHKFLDSFQI